MKLILKNVVLSALAIVAMGMATSANAAGDKKAAINAISNHFSSVPTMTGEFIQFGPKGEQTGGKFYIYRPGRMRLDYEDPSPLKLISNGRTLGVNNRKLKTWNFYPLNKTPLSLLLSDKIEINDKSIKSVTAGEDVTTVVMGDKRIFGDSEITLLFDPKSQELRQWTIKDAQGRETSVLIFNVEKNVKLSKTLFAIDREKKKRNRNTGGEK